MITAADTNVLLDILSASPAHLAWSMEALSLARRDGAVVICEIVHAELAAAFAGDLSRLDAFMTDASLRLVRSSVQTHGLAGKMWREYRRRGGARKRILPDFLIGAHALKHANRLLTRDRGFYRSCFGDLELLALT
jgi:predicted nucleic acid-binding protein